MNQLSLVLRGGLTGLAGLAGLASLAACSKSSDQPNVHGKAIDGVVLDARAAAALPSKLPAQFGSWDLPARAKAWQGANVMEESAGFALAFEVTGAAVKTWDGKAEKQLAFALESPCSAKLSEKGTDGSESSTITHFTVKGGKLMAGLGDAGSRNGKSAIACISNEILTVDDAGTCLAWESMFDTWKSSPATCGFAQKNGKEVFTAKVNGMDTTLQVDGDALLSDQLAHGASIAFPDFATAKAARDKK